MPNTFNVPELGENVKSATVAKVLVAAGQKIERDQPIVELETDKVALEVPAETAGVIDEVLVKEGDEVKVGQALFKVRADGGPAAGAAPAKAANAEPAESEESAEPAEPPARSGKKAPAAEPAKKRAEPAAVEPAAAEPPPPKDASAAPANLAPAAPSVRRFAREIGVDLAAVAGTGPRGRISIEDVKAHARRRAAEARPAAAGGTAVAPVPLPDFTPWGGVDRQPMAKIRRIAADRTAHAWSVIPHVTQFGRADVTETERLRHQYKGDAERAGGRLTLLAIVIKTVAGALKAFPRFNASVDMDRHELVYRQCCHVGVAMDTERGLLVPVLRDVDKKNVIEISVELAKLAAQARDGTLKINDMRGGCFTISNVGALGGDLFTPIINWPEVAILGMARSRVEPVHRDGAFFPRTILPLALSYDHRANDGADGVRFLQWIVAALEEPVKLLWEG